MHIPLLTLLLLVPVLTDKTTRDNYLSEAERLLKIVNNDIKENLNKIKNLFFDEKEETSSK